MIIVSFFILGVATTLFRYEYKKSIGTAQEKGGARSWPNILANGGLAAVFGLAELAFGGSVFALLYIGAMSAAASDTVATELGLLSKSVPRLITRFGAKVSPGYVGRGDRTGLPRYHHRCRHHRYHGGGSRRGP